jgi:DNA-binding LacI/PurR family transcriptional regulator
MAKRVTSIEVAKRAGVSQSTVSRVFTPNSRVSQDKRDRVLKAAAELGYQPNAIARSLSMQRTNIIGIVMANITSPFYPYVLEMFLQRFQASGRQVLLFTAAPNQDIDDILPHIIQHRVDALIVTSATLSSEMAEECARFDIPVILFNRYVLGTHASAVCCDNVEGGRQVANLFLDTGHQRLAYIAGRVNTSTNSDREKGFTDRLRERGVTDWLREQAAFTYDTGYAAAVRLLSRPDRPDAIFCGSDNMAVATIDAARSEFGLRIPHDLSVVGFDDIPMAGWPSYRLTTIRQEVEQMIDATLDLLDEHLEEPDAPIRLELVPGTLVIRDSVRGLSPHSDTPPTG